MANHYYAMCLRKSSVYFPDGAAGGLLFEHSTAALPVRKEGARGRENPFCLWVKAIERLASHGGLRQQ
jgi:hypothetical protein